jgi:4-hydroxybenzoate polyprenyltransferase
MSEHTDIRLTGWISLLPPSVVPYVLLARLDRPIGIWLLFLPGLWTICLTASNFWTGLWLAALFALGSIVMRGAGCVVNDLWDRDLDAQVARTRGRPLASGAVTVPQAVIFLVALCLAGLVILSQLNRLCWGLGVLSLVLVALYPLAKRFTWWPQAILGVTFGWGAPMGYAAAAGHLGWPALPLYAGTILWILGYDTIYAHQDRDDDALIGVKSTARLFGDETAKMLIACYGGAVLLILVGMAGFALNPWGYWLVLAPGALLGWQIVRLDIIDPERCLQLFKLNRDVGILMALAILVGRIS